MSDFDREAEREKLREKYERDKRKRESSERMSELLLQGATMTNRHCPECHSPVFQYDGREFCPTCQREVSEEGELLGSDADGTESARDGADADSRDGDADDEPDASDAPAGETSAASADDPAHPGESVEETTRSGDETDSSPESRPAPARDRRPARIQPPVRRGPAADRAESSDDGRRDDRRSEGDLREAESALLREIETLTRRAEETRDVGRKRDLLAAAREAAETLEALYRL